MKMIATACLMLMASSAIGNDESHIESCSACDEAIDLVIAVEAYASAWRNNDPDAVIATFADDFTLSPPGMPYVEGVEAAREFWWPAGAPTARITVFRIEPAQTSASDNIGYVRGHFELEFEYDGSFTATRGKFLSVLERGSDGWKIKHHFWDTLPAETGS